MLFFVYLDDILIVGTRRFVKKTVRRARHRLQKVGFIIKKKSETERARRLDFVGKISDLESPEWSGSCSNCMLCCAQKCQHGSVIVS